MRRGVAGHWILAVLSISIMMMSAPVALGDSLPAGSLTAESASAVNSGDPRLLQITFSDPVIGPDPVHVRVLLPVGYGDSDLRYPVLYLLHGLGGSSADWTTQNDGQPQSLEQFTASEQAKDGQGVIIVMPEAGSGWYTNDYNGGAFGPPEWETFHIQQLIPYIDSHFRTLVGRDDRAIAGLSMGGFGAMSYAARHPDLFVAAFSFSGVVNTIGAPPISPAWDEQFSIPTWEPAFGPWETNELYWRGHNPVDLVPNLHGMTLSFTTGMGVPGGPAPDDTTCCPGNETGEFIENQEFDAALTNEGIAHTYISYPMGEHDWWHWQQDLHEDWPQLLATFAAPPPPPSPFSYCSIDPQFGIWGWRLTIHRPADEYLTMEQVDASGLTLVGSGTVDVTTPPVYQPHHTYTVAVGHSDENLNYQTQTVTPAELSSSDNFCAAARSQTSTPRTTETNAVTADDHGQLHFTVTLGPGHLDQQYTAQERADEVSTPNYWEVAGVRISPSNSQ